MKRTRLVSLAVSICLVASLLTALVVAGCAKPAPEPAPAPVPEWPPPKPEVITFASYTLGSGTYVHLAAAAEGVAKKFGIKFRMVPTAGGISRLNMVKGGRADIAVVGPDHIYAHEAVADFGAVDWGPQPVRLVWLGLEINGDGPAVLRDSPIYTWDDVRTFREKQGRKLRVPFILGSPGQQMDMRGLLSFAGLTWEDVDKVETESWGSMYKMLGDGKVDLSIMYTVASATYELEASPRGMRWIEVPPASDVEAWKEYHKFHPTYNPGLCSVGAGLSEENPKCLTVLIAPMVTAYDNLDEGTAYWVAKSFNESYDLYKDMMPALKGWSLEHAMDYFVGVWHEGTVKYLKEIGAWDAQHERNQKALLEREETLVELWDAALAEFAEKGMAEGDWPAFWEAKRKAAFPYWYLALD